MRPSRRQAASVGARRRAGGRRAGGVSVKSLDKKEQSLHLRLSNDFTNSRRGPYDERQHPRSSTPVRSAVRFLVEAEESGGSVSVFDCGSPDVKTPAPHSHDGFKETIYGLEGVSTWTVNGAAREVGPGEALCIRRGQVHGFANRGGHGRQVPGGSVARGCSGPATSWRSVRWSPPRRAAARPRRDQGGDAPPRADAGAGGRLTSARAPPETPRDGRLGAPRERDPPVGAPPD